MTATYLRLPSISGGGTITIGTFGTTPNANGLSISGSVLTAQPADASHPGMISIVSQTFTGLKSFNTSIGLPTFNSGAIPYVSSAKSLTQDPGNLFYDTNNKRLGLQTSAPSAVIHSVTSIGVTVSDPNSPEVNEIGLPLAGTPSISANINYIANLTNSPMGSQNGTDVPQLAGGISANQNEAESGYVANGSTYTYRFYTYSDGMHLNGYTYNYQEVIVNDNSDGEPFAWDLTYFDPFNAGGASSQLVVLVDVNGGGFNRGTTINLPSSETVTDNGSWATPPDVSSTVTYFIATGNTNTYNFYTYSAGLSAFTSNFSQALFTDDSSGQNYAVNLTWANDPGISASSITILRQINSGGFTNARVITIPTGNNTSDFNNFSGSTTITPNLDAYIATGITRNYNAFFVEVDPNNLIYYSQTPQNYAAGPDANDGSSYVVQHTRGSIDDIKVVGAEDGVSNNSSFDFPGGSFNETPTVWIGNTVVEPNQPGYNTDGATRYYRIYAGKYVSSGTIYSTGFASINITDNAVNTYYGIQVSWNQGAIAGDFYKIFTSTDGVTFTNEIIVTGFIYTDDNLIVYGSDSTVTPTSSFVPALELEGSFSSPSLTSSTLPALGTIVTDVAKASNGYTKLAFLDTGGQMGYIQCDTNGLTLSPLTGINSVGPISITDGSQQITIGSGILELVGNSSIHLILNSTEISLSNGSVSLLIESGAIVASGPFHATEGFGLGNAVITGSSFTVSNASQLVFVNHSAGTAAITLPDCSLNQGLEFIIVNQNASQTVTILPGAFTGSKINGSSSYSLTAQYKFLRVTTDGSTWYIVGSN